MPAGSQDYCYGIQVFDLTIDQICSLLEKPDAKGKLHKYSIIVLIQFNVGKWWYYSVMPPVEQLIILICDSIGI